MVGNSSEAVLPQGPRWLPVLVLALAVALVYSNALDGPFLLDDADNIVKNPALRQWWPLSTALNPPPADVTFYTRPFINLTMCVDYALWGLNPRGYHLTSLLFHLAASLTLFGLLRLAFRSSGRDENEARLLALAGALLWAVHPLTTSAVNYLSQRPEVAVGLFFFLTLYGLHRAVISSNPRPPSTAGPMTQPETRDLGASPGGKATPRANPYASILWLLATFISCLLGMGSKESMAAAPLLAMAYDRIFLSPSWKEVFRRRGLFYVLLATTWIWPLARQMAFSPHLSGTPIQPWTFKFYLWVQAWGLVRMIHLAIWPCPLIFDYGERMPGLFGHVWIQVLLLALMLAATARALKRHPRIGFLLLCFFAILAPASLVPVLGQPVAEHRMYAPLAMLVILAVAGLDHAIRRSRVRQPGLHQRIFLMIVAIWVLILAALAHQRNKVYQDEARLWMDTVAKRPSNGRAWHNLGNALSARGMYGRALEAFHEAARLKPHMAETRGNLANTLCALGQYEAALSYYREAIRLNKAYAPAYSGLGCALSALGQQEEALAQHQIALRLNPNSAEVQFNMANTLACLNRHEEAVVHFQKAIALKPQAVEFRNNLGNSLKALRRYEEALACYREILRRQPGSVPASGNLGLTLLEMGIPDKAREVFMTAARSSRRPSATLFEYASVLISRGYLAEGLELSERVLDMQSHHPLALNNAAWIMATATNETLRDGPRALVYAQQAVELLGNDTPAVWATLAAAEAEAGHLDKAVATARHALDMAHDKGDPNLVAQYEVRLETYRQGKAWREE